MRMRFRMMLLAAGLVLSVSDWVRAEELPKSGRLNGYYVVTRTGEKMLVNGFSTYFVADDVAAKLAPFEGKPIAVEALRIVQEMNPGAGMIMEVAKVEARTASPDIALTVKQELSKVDPTPPGVTLTVTLENKGTKGVQVIPRNVRVVLATNKPAEPKGWKDAEGRAYWYHQEGMGFGKTALVFAYHDERPGWTAKQMIAEGKGITLVSAPGDSNPIVLFGAGGTYAAEVKLGKELPAGSYEAFVFVEGEGGAVAMSARVSVEVAERAME